MKWREDVNNVPKGGVPKVKRGSKNNLTIGAFGQPHKEFRSKLWKKLGSKLPPATKKGKLPATYTPFKEKKVKYLPHVGEKQCQKARNKMKKKQTYSIHDVRHKGITGDTPIDFFEGEFYTSKDVKKLLKRRK